MQIGEKLSDEWVDDQISGFHRLSHRLIVEGHDRATAARGDLEEEVITGLLLKGMKDYLNTDAPLYFDSYFPEEEQRVDNGVDTGKRRQRLDIVVESSSSRPRLRLEFEAKVLRKNGFGIGGYVDEEGLLSFVNEEYAFAGNIACMIAYLQSDGIKYWFRELNRRFTDKKSAKLEIELPLRHISVINELQDEWVSVHRRQTLKPIVVLHMFLDCCNS